MLSRIIRFSVTNKATVLFLTAVIIGLGIYSATQLPVGAVPDITNNQVQVITTSRNLSTQDMEQFITYPVELEMANIPGVTEIRSVTKFGLSVVTIVFEEDMGTYLPRQLIAEKIKSASEKIPPSFGIPEMGPITTGLGEIYQYTLDTKPGYKGKYTATELRTFQDWIVKRQLAGIKGVVEVNTWGGNLKQYEVAINTQKLNAMDITTAEVITALEKNNSTAGGSYIEKVNQAYFIRGEGLIQSLEDIKNTVVKTKDGLPIYIKNIAKVGFGTANRFGAITANGEGEKVLGQVMMLKDANSNKVIKAVQERVKSISKSLPDGVFINPFLDRSDLISKTTNTIKENLILGFLIVVFIVIVFLGDFRSGLIIASVIPLSLLFTLSLMYFFGVDANLMSLGAIDFGIIIDGTVIIVEFIVFSLTNKAGAFNLSKYEKDKMSIAGTSKMMNSAIFGQLIILIVFIPILSLTGVEGKMFKPMALTFSFALIGAMVLCFTYVPVVSAMFLKPLQQSPKNISVRILGFLNKLYEPAIKWALVSKRMVLGISSVFLIMAIIVFSNMGSEFVPTIDEGDFAIQPALKTGTSLSKTIETTTKIEKILLDSFPEVEQVVSRIGAGEIPTDPMSMEQSDIMVKLKPKTEWLSANSKDELADKFKEALSILPGIEFEFSQPIEMRFNELITGIKADIAVKIFGDDMIVLNELGNKVKLAIADVQGASDIAVEKTAGLPQINVKFDRSKIARYGLNIADLNEMIAIGFGGQTVGEVFEGEKRFDLVVRLEPDNRKGISDIENLLVDLPQGGKIPLNQLAEISYKKGAAQISRDATKRRVVVGINVRNRDLQSVVDDIQHIIDTKIDIPVGYSVSYGGQFENLKSARNRLLIAVPIALLLIFVMLYFAFKSVKEALIIYSAIPLAAVGGVFLLWFRDMPFSISAGIGFIALFGIAVLNGVVLIEYFKELKAENKYNTNELIIIGSKARLRAVLLTALTDALGFLPMAISTGAGAEVQKPLATVVIGGLFTATILTLVVLPVLYSVFQNNKIKFGSVKSVLTVFIGLFVITGSVNAQNNELGYEELKTIALQNNAGLKASNLQVQQSKKMIGTAFNIDKTEFFYNYDENNIAFNNKPIRVFGVQQDFRFPTVYGAKRNELKAEYNIQLATYAVKQQLVEKEFTQSYYAFQSAKQKEKEYLYLDSLYASFAKAAKRKFELGESNYLEKITAEAKQKQLAVQLTSAQEDVQTALIKLKNIIQSDSVYTVAVLPPQKIKLLEVDINNNAGLLIYNNQSNLFEVQHKVQKQSLLPDISLEYFQGTNSGLGKSLSGYQIGLKVPLFYGAKSATIKSAKLQIQSFEENKKDYSIHLNAKHKELLSKKRAYEAELKYFENDGQRIAQEILKVATVSFKSGEIDFYQYIQNLENASEIKLQHIETLKKYNQTVIAINYLIL